LELETLRALERMFVVIFGGLSILLGYRLFLKLPERADSSGKLVLPGDISVFISRVGPGVFFCLFGVAVLVMALQHGLELKTAQNAANVPNADTTTRSSETVNSREVRYADQTPIDDGRRDALRAEARRSIAELSKFPSLLAPGTPQTRRNDVLQAVRASKLALMRTVWAADWGDFEIFRNWVNDDDAMDPAPAGISPDAIRTFRQTRE
jgi:hypothetical protein